MPVKVAAVLRTNLPSKSIPKDFLNRLSDALVKQFHADIQVIPKVTRIIQVSVWQTGNTEFHADIQVSPDSMQTLR